MNDMTNENQLIVVKEYEFDKTDIHEIDYILDDVIKDCRKKYFHSFEYRIIYDLCFKNVSNNEEVNFVVTHRSMEFKTEFYGLNKKIKNARENGYIFNHINKLTIKIYSNLSNINIQYYLKHCIPMGQRLFFRRIAHNRDYIQTHCNDINNPFHFACRQWYLHNNPGVFDQI